MNAVVETTAGLFQRIGRYFSVVSVVPGLLLIVNLCFILGATRQQAGVDLSQGWNTLANLGISAWIGIVGAAVVVGLLLHPFQYALTQFYEGYWGPRRASVALATKRILAHRSQAAQLEEAAALLSRTWISQSHRSRPAWFRTKYRGAHNAAVRSQLALERLHAPEMDFLIPKYVESETYFKALVRYPDNHGRMMPTRLGNVLRRHEDRIGSVYGLDAVLVAPFLSQVAREKDLDRVSDEGEQMDLALRLCFVFFVTTGAYTFLLAGRGLWVAAALVPYGCAYLAYRGACVAAENYMVAVGVMIHLNRFLLYDALHLGRPKNLEDELRIADETMEMLRETYTSQSWKYSY